MHSRAVIDLNCRTISRRSLLWNRLTPTWGAKAVCRTLAEKSSACNLKIDAKDGLLKRYVKSLGAAGVMELAIEQGTSAQAIKKMLNTLTDRGFGAAARIAAKRGFAIVGPSTMDWGQIRTGLVKADYGVNYAIDIEWAVRPFQYVFRALCFLKDCKVLDRLARGEKLPDPQRLIKITNRLDHRDFKEFHQEWDFEMLAFLGAWNHYFLEDNRKVTQAVSSARFLSDPVRLPALAANPVPIVRAAAAKNVSLPEPELDRLVNQDPDRSVREAVAQNPKIMALVSLAANSYDAEELAGLARKPFPCVREKVAMNPTAPRELLQQLAETDPRRRVQLAAAKNPNTPWGSVTLVLSRFEKEPIEGVIRTDMINCAGPCDDPDYQPFEVRGVVGYGYSSDSLKTAKEILILHPEDKRSILGKLKELNVDLYEALNDKSA